MHGLWQVVTYLNSSTKLASIARLHFVFLKYRNRVSRSRRTLLRLFYIHSMASHDLHCYWYFCCGILSNARAALQQQTTLSTQSNFKTSQQHMRCSWAESVMLLILNFEGFVKMAAARSAGPPHTDRRAAASLLGSGETFRQVRIFGCFS